LNKPKKVVLAYSGGLDTSIIIPWLKENYGCEVIALIGDVGQQEDLEAGAKKRSPPALPQRTSKICAKSLCATTSGRLSAPAPVYEHTYLLGTSMARPVIAKRQAEIALKLGADGLSHGCTGKGNDSSPFRIGLQSHRAHVRIIAPWREWDIDSAKMLLPTRRSTTFPSSRARKHLQPRSQHLAPQPRRRRARRSCQRAERSDVAMGRFTRESSGQSRGS